MYQCRQCSQSFESASAIASHTRWSHKIKQIFTCDKCNRQFSDNSSLANHVKYCTGPKKTKIYPTCPKCKFIIKKFFDVHIAKCDGRGPSRSRRHLGLGTGHNWLKGKKYKDVFGEKRAKQIIANISNSLIGKSTGQCLSESDEKLRKHKISIARVNFLNSGKNKCRGRSGWYKGIWCDSSWELVWVIYNIDHNIKFKRNHDKFAYQINDEQHFYVPDFILDDGTLIEIKGYTFNPTKLKLKINSVPSTYKFILLQKNEMKPILQYVRRKYGKKFYKMYEQGEMTEHGLLCQS